jgi:hypothetical protein
MLSSYLRVGQVQRNHCREGSGHFEVELGVLLTDVAKAAQRLQRLVQQLLQRLVQQLLQRLVQTNQGLRLV